MDEKGKEKERVKETLQVHGWVEVIVRDRNGRIKYVYGSSPKLGGLPHPIISSMPAQSLSVHYWRSNVITNVGLACVIRLVFEDLTEVKFGYLAIGTGTMAEALSDTQLEAEVHRKRASVSQITTVWEGDTALLEATWSAEDGLTGIMNISETGVFNASSGGTLLARKVFPAIPVNWDAGDRLTIRYYIQMTR